MGQFRVSYKIRVYSKYLSTPDRASDAARPKLERVATSGIPKTTSGMRLMSITLK